MIWSRVALPASALLPRLLQELLGAQLQFAPPLLQVLLTAALTRGNHASSGLLSEDVITGGWTLAGPKLWKLQKDDLDLLISQKCVFVLINVLCVGLVVPGTVSGPR